MKFAVLADDLTGSLVSATRLRLRGLNVDVVWHATQLNAIATADAVVVDMRTRDVRNGHYVRARSWGNRLLRAGFRQVECRMDSSLNGHTREEVAGLIDALGHATPIVLAVPAAPGAGRTTRDGIQRIHNESSGATFDRPVAPVIFGGQPYLLIDRGILAQGADHIAARILSGRQRSGPTWVVADGETEEDLATVADAAGQLAHAGQVLITVSPGMWLAYYPLPEHGDFTLVVVASPTAENVTQQAELQRIPGIVFARPGEVLNATAATLRGQLQPGATFVISTVSRPTAVRTSPPARQAAAAALAVLTTADQAGVRCRRVVISGGSSARRLADALGAAGLRPVDQISPMCARARIKGGRWDGLHIVTKGGQVGKPGTLAALAMAAPTSAT